MKIRRSELTGQCKWYIVEFELDGEIYNAVISESKTLIGDSYTKDTEITAILNEDGDDVTEVLALRKDFEKITSQILKSYDRRNKKRVGSGNRTK